MENSKFERQDVMDVRIDAVEHLLKSRNPTNALPASVELLRVVNTYFIEFGSKARYDIALASSACDASEARTWLRAARLRGPYFDSLENCIPFVPKLLNWRLIDLKI